MSYSVCLECMQMVYASEKYCSRCEKTKKSNPADFWKNRDGSFLQEPKRSQELARDAIDPNNTPALKEREFHIHEIAEEGASPRGNRAQRRKAIAMERGK